jgi:hypothetical protein
MERYVDRLGKILADLDYRVVPGLADRIIFTLEKKRKKLAEMRAAVFGTLAVGSIAGLYLLIQAAAAQFSATGTPQLVSLVFSDFTIVVANFGDYFASIAESLPVLPTIGALSLALILFVSFIFAVNNFKKAVKTKLTYAPRHS